MKKSIIQVVPKLVFLDHFWQISGFLVKFDAKNDLFFLTHFLSKNVYNDVLCINGSKVTALNAFHHLNVCITLNGILKYRAFSL